MKREIRHWIGAIAVGMLLLGSSGAQAASFDCAKAQSKVEKMICADAELSKLDEDMAHAWARYREKYFYEEHVRGTQKNWIAQRNRCTSTQCLLQAYQERIAFINSGQTQPVTLGELKGKLRKFDHCRISDGNCTENGSGYTVCEAYLKHLNAMPADQARNGCRPWIDTSRKDFTEPSWEVLDPYQYTRWIFEIEKVLNRGHAEDGPRSKTYEQWQAHWLNEIKSKGYHPRLKRIRMKVDDALGEESFVAYDAWGSTCDNDQPLEAAPHGFGESDYALLVMRGQPPDVAFTEVSPNHGDLVMFQNKPYWVAYGTDIPRRFGNPQLWGMYASMGRFTAWPPDSDDKRYLNPSMCQYNEVWPMSTYEQIREQILLREHTNTKE